MPSKTTPNSICENAGHLCTPIILVIHVMDINDYESNKQLYCYVFQPIQDLASSPPESSFQKLAPSEHRYTLLREKDEL